MNKVWFGSDLHFDHKNIIKFTNRPFDTVLEMNAYMLARINDMVSPGDRVYLLGDIQFKNDMDILEELTRKVEVHLIHGNHDSDKTRDFWGWTTSSSYKEIRIDGQKIVMFHYPIEEWNGKTHGSIHLHGHTHGMMSHPNQYIPNRLDVGYDNIGEVLISYEDVCSKIIQERIDKDLMFIREES